MSVRRRFRGNTLLGAAHAKITPQYIDELCDDGMSRQLAKAVWARYDADSTDLETIQSLAEQCVFVRK